VDVFLGGLEMVGARGQHPVEVGRGQISLQRLEKLEGKTTTKRCRH